MKLHTTATWSARDDRRAPLFWLALFLIGTFLGFGLDLKHYFHQHPAAPMGTHAHAVIYTIWLVILTAQVLLVESDKVAWHKRLGWFAAGWAALMLVFGFIAIMGSESTRLHSADFDAPFIAVSYANLINFSWMIGWGIKLRKNPAAHRRLMMLSAVAFADPVSRG